MLTPTDFVAFVVAIGLLVAVHEWGHYAMARACGVKVLRFAIGFGPKVVGWTSPRSGTEWVLGALPLGGYVKMLDEREGPVEEQQRHQAFNTQSLTRRALIVAAGPVANLLFAVLLYSTVNWMGVQQAQAVLAKPLEGSVAAKAGLVGREQILSVGFEGDDLEAVASFDDFRWWLTRAALAHRNLQVETADTPSGPGKHVLLPLSGFNARNADVQMFRDIGILGPYTAPRMGEIDVGGAANAAGLLEGDLVLKINDKPVVDAGDLFQQIRNAGKSGVAQTQIWLIERGGVQRVLTVTPKVEDVAGQSVGRIAAMIKSSPATTIVRFGPIDGVRQALIRTAEVSVLTLRMMGQIAIGNASLKNLSGPITIADYAGKSAALGFTQFMVFLALISISLGVLNLLPLPVLDGGHLMYYLWESLTGKPISESSMEWLQRLGLGILLTMMSVAVFNDVARLLG